jgi:hypothetical protein
MLDRAFGCIFSFQCEIKLIAKGHQTRKDAMGVLKKIFQRVAAFLSFKRRIVGNQRDCQKCVSGA